MLTTCPLIRTRRLALAILATTLTAAAPAAWSFAADPEADDQAGAGTAEPVDAGDTDAPPQADEPDGGLGLLAQNFRVGFPIAANSWQELTFDATQEWINITLLGAGSSNLDLVVYDDSGIIAIGRSPRDIEHIQAPTPIFFTNPHPVHVIVFNWGKADNWCTVASY